LGEVLGVAEQHEQSGLLVDEFAQGVDDKADEFAGVWGCGDDEVVHIVFDVEELLLEVGGRGYFEFGCATEDGGVVLEV
jgi:hypothetical protein